MTCVLSLTAQEKNEQNNKNNYVSTYGSTQTYCLQPLASGSHQFEIDNTPSGYYCEWYLNNTFLETDQATSISDPKYTLSVNGNYQVLKALIYNSSWTLLESHKWFINLTAATSQTISGNSTVCYGTSNTYSISPSILDVVHYTWTYPSSWTNYSYNQNSITANTNQTGNVYAKPYIPDCNCSGTQVSKSVTVNPLPSAATISGTTACCEGATATFSATSTNATSFTWTAPSSWSPSSGTGSNFSTTVGSSGTTVSVTPSNSCGDGVNGYKSLTITNIPSTPGQISGPSSVCNGQQSTFSISSVSGATSYTWTLPSGWSGNSTSTSITCTPGSSSGSISVKANNSCGSSQQSWYTVAVSSAPSQPGSISGSTTVCSGTSQSYSISSVSGATSYTWSYTGGGTPSGTGTSCSFSPTSSGTLSVVANNSCGSSNQRTINITVNSAPSQPGTISGNVSPCSGTSQSYSISSVSGATSYTWSYTGGGSPSGTGTSCTFSPTSSGTLTVVANNSCGASSASTISITVSSAPSQPGTISGNVSPCSGTSQSYSISSVSGATSYTWSYSGGGTPSGTSTSCTLTPTGSGTISVVANNSCGVSSAATLTLNLNSSPTTPIISGNTTICQGQSTTLNITNPCSNCTFSWSNGGTGASITVNSEGTYYATATNTCGTSPSSNSITVTLSGTGTAPSQPGSISGTFNVQTGTTQTYQITSVTGANSYSWSVPSGSGWSINSGQGSTSINLTTGSSSGDICVYASNNCGDSPAQCQSITVIPSGIDGIAAFNNILIYPNPNTGLFTIELENTKPIKLVIKITNIIGQTVYEKDLGTVSGLYKKEIELNKQAKGIYTLQFITDEGTTVREIVVK